MIILQKERGENTGGININIINNMADEIEVRKRRFLTLQKRLKEERLFVKQEKEQLRKLNEKLLNVSQNLFYLEWKNRKQWMNIDRLVSGKANPAECSNTSRLIESIKFEDACSHLNYQDSQYGAVLLKLKENPKLVALILDYCDNKKFQTTTRHLCRLFISTLYGSCAEKRDELCVLKILNELMELQVLSCEDLLQFFCGKRSTENAFACVFTVFSEMLFSSKLYLTAALHGTVMQVIVDDAIFLDVEVSKVVSRIPPKTVLEKFGQAGTLEAKDKINQHMAVLHDHILALCNKFLKSLHDKIYCFPQSLRWAIAHLYEGMLTKMKLPQANAKAIIGYMLMSYFICPAIINPEPYGINSDADISETARHNLGLVASILRSLALIECGLKDEKLKIILDRFEEGKVMAYVSHLLNGATNIPVMESEGLPEVTKCSLLITEHDLKSLLSCLRLLQSYNPTPLNEEGLNDLLDELPPTPRRWQKSPNGSLRNIQSMPPGSNIENCAPTRPPRLKKMASSGHNTLEATKEELDQLKEDLHTMINKDDIVLVVPLGNETEQHAGMLSEEKVLGLTSKLPTSNSFDMDTIAKDISQRTRTFMIDALRESFGDTNLLDLSNENLDSISSSSMNSVPPDENSVKSKEIDELNGIFFGNNIEISKNDLESVSGTTNGVVNTISTKTTKNGVPMDELICFSDSESSPGPALPEKRLNHHPVSSVFNDVPLIDLEINDQQQPTGHGSRNVSTSSDNMNRQLSSQSMLGGPGGINDILKNAAVPSPTVVKNAEFHTPWSPVGVENNPWVSNAMADAEEENEESNGFENNFIPPSLSEKKSHSPKSTNKHSVDPKYADYAETIQRIQKSPGLRKKFGIDFNLKLSNEQEEEKLSRKKSGGAWLKDKISTIGTGLRTNRLKSGDSNINSKKDSENSGRSSPANSGRGAKDFSTLQPPKPPTSPRGTPLEASERSKKKSQSFIARRPSQDVSEAIMEKYRNIATGSSPNDGLDASLDTLSESQMDQVLVQVQKDEVVFDDEFKFEDAKRKLRTVFCTADQASLPSDAKSFDHLLLTMLQAKLAEAINLQDRFSVAQLHETLRSIKQLPAGSCEKLIEKLESDYEERSKYISYLIQTKQGLLSTISHIEQVTAKMHRDKMICSRYFTTLSVRLFLETQERKRDLAIFANRFASTNMLDEKSALLNEFLQSLNNKMVEESTWSHCTDEQIDDAQVATERAIMSKIFKEAFYPNQLTDIENDRIFHEHISRLARMITLSHPALQIPKMYQKEAPWPSAQTELLMVNAYKTAADKLACIHRCCVTIMNLLSMASEKQAPGADDFVPVLVFVVLRANPPNLLSTKQYVNTFYETRLSGEEYYCWMQFCAAIEFIKTLRCPDE